MRSYVVSSFFVWMREKERERERFLVCSMLVSSSMHQLKSVQWTFSSTYTVVQEARTLTSVVLCPCRTCVRNEHSSDMPRTLWPSPLKSARQNMSDTPTTHIAYMCPVLQDNTCILLGKQCKTNFSTYF